MQKKKNDTLKILMQLSLPGAVYNLLCFSDLRPCVSAWLVCDIHVFYGTQYFEIHDRC